MPNQIDLREIQGAVATRGVNICVGIPALLMIGALFVRKYLDFLADPALEPDRLEYLGYAFVAVAAIDLVAAFILKKRRLSPLALKQRIAPDPAALGPRLADAYLPIFIVAAAPALYGLIFYFLGGDLDTYVLISVFCPAGLLLLKPREKEVERLASEILGVPARAENDE